MPILSINQGSGDLKIVFLHYYHTGLFLEIDNFFKKSQKIEKSKRKSHFFSKLRNYSFVAGVDFFNVQKSAFPYEAMKLVSTSEDNVNFRSLRYK